MRTLHTTRDERASATSIPLGRLGLVLAMAMTSTACGGSVPAGDAGGPDVGICGANIEGSCDRIEAGMHLCDDYVGGAVWLAMAESSCRSSGATWTTSLCSHDVSLGGCERAFACGQSTQWYYEGSFGSPEELRTVCNEATPDSYRAP